MSAHTLLPRDVVTRNTSLNAARKNLVEIAGRSTAVLPTCEKQQRLHLDLAQVRRCDVHRKAIHGNRITTLPPAGWALSNLAIFTTDAKYEYKRSRSNDYVPHGMSYSVCSYLPGQAAAGGVLHLLGTTLRNRVLQPQCLLQASPARRSSELSVMKNVSRLLSKMSSGNILELTSNCHTYCFVYDDSTLAQRTGFSPARLSFFPISRHPVPSSTRSIPVPRGGLASISLSHSLANAVTRRAGHTARQIHPRLLS